MPLPKTANKGETHPNLRNPPDALSRWAWARRRIKQVAVWRFLHFLRRSTRTRWPVHTLTPLRMMFTPLAVLPESGLTTKSVQCAGQRAGTSASV